MPRRIVRAGARPPACRLCMERPNVKPIINRSMCRSIAAHFEAQLVGRCLSGDNEAWNHFYYRYHGYLRDRVARFLGRRGRDRQLVDEIAQSVWISLIPSRALLHAYDAKRGPLKSFLSVVALQGVAAHLRPKRQSTVELKPFWALLAVAQVGEDATALADFLTILPPKQRHFCETSLLGSRDHRCLQRTSGASGRKMSQRIRVRLLAFQRED